MKPRAVPPMFSLKVQTVENYNAHPLARVGVVITVVSVCTFKPSSTHMLFNHSKSIFLLPYHKVGVVFSAEWDKGGQRGKRNRYIIKSPRLINYLLFKLSKSGMHGWVNDICIWGVKSRLGTQSLEYNHNILILHFIWLLKLIFFIEESS